MTIKIDQPVYRNAWTGKMEGIIHTSTHFTPTIWFLRSDRDHFSPIDEHMFEQVQLEIHVVMFAGAILSR